MTYAPEMTCKRCGGWTGAYAGFPDQHKNLCHCGSYTALPNQMTNQYALGFKACQDAAVKVAIEYAESTIEEEVEALQALPVPEVQCDVNELLDVLQEAVDGMGGSYATWSPKARAVIAKFKEVNNV